MSRPITDYKIRFWKFVELIPFHECWEWIGSKHWTGYGQLHMPGTMGKAHRISYKIHYGNFPKELHVLHKCDNPGCVNPHHLFLGTNLDNVKDKVSKGRQGRVYLNGEKCGTSKFKNEIILQIRKEYSEGNISQRKLAKKHNMTQGNIGFILRRESWKHV
jgi:hypothetical protein